MFKRSLCVAIAGLSLVGCAASQQSIATLNQLTYDCQRGYQQACAYIPAQQAQVNAEANANTTALAVGLGGLAVAGAVAGVAASDHGYYHHGYYGRHGYYGY